MMAKPKIAKLQAELYSVKNGDDMREKKKKSTHPLTNFDQLIGSNLSAPFQRSSLGRVVTAGPKFERTIFDQMKDDEAGSQLQLRTGRQRSASLVAAGVVFSLTPQIRIQR